MTDNSRTALLMHCSEEEAKLIREAAKRERCTMNDYILRAALRRIKKREELARKLQQEPKRLLVA